MANSTTYQYSDFLGSFYLRVGKILRFQCTLTSDRFGTLSSPKIFHQDIIMILFDLQNDNFHKSFTKRLSPFYHIIQSYSSFTCINDKRAYNIIWTYGRWLVKEALLFLFKQTPLEEKLVPGPTESFQGQCGHASRKRQGRTSFPNRPLCTSRIKRADIDHPEFTLNQHKDLQSAEHNICIVSVANPHLLA